MNSQSIFRSGAILLALVNSAVQAAVSNVSPPLSEASAKAVFERSNFHEHPDVVPNLVKGAPVAPQPGLPAVPPQVHRVKRPKKFEPVFNFPGIPQDGLIAVSINKTIPFKANSTLEERACPNVNCCPDPRCLNENTAFPWSATGLWQWDKGECSGRWLALNMFWWPPPVLTVSRSYIRLTSLTDRLFSWREWKF